MTKEDKSLVWMFLMWWYGEAFTRFLAFLKQFFFYLADLFSVKISLKTLFYPWKRDQYSTEGLSLQQRFQVWSLNLTSRLIGAIVKLLTLVIFLLFSFAGLSLSALAMFSWLLWPILLLGTIVYGIGLVVG